MSALLVLKIVCCAALGYGCWLAADKWIAYLLHQREKEYNLTPALRWTVRAACVLFAGAIGGLVDGIPSIVCGLLLLTVCAVLSVTDWTNRVIPNPCILVLLGMKLVFGIPALLGVPGFPECDILQSLIGLVACGVLFALPGMFGKNVGAGDIKLAAAMGFFLGVFNALLAVIVMGLLVIGYGVAQKGIPMLEFFRKFIPIGPFIAVGFVVVYIGAPYLPLLLS